MANQQAWGARPPATSRELLTLLQNDDFPYRLDPQSLVCRGNQPVRKLRYSSLVVAGGWARTPRDPVDFFLAGLPHEILRVGVFDLGRIGAFSVGRMREAAWRAEHRTHAGIRQRIFKGGDHLSTSSMVGRQHSISALGSSSPSAPSPTKELNNATPPTPTAPVERKDASTECGGDFPRGNERRCGDRPSVLDERGETSGKGEGAAGQKAAMQRVAVARQRHRPAGLPVRERARQLRNSAMRCWRCFLSAWISSLRLKKHSQKMFHLGVESNSFRRVS